VPSADTPCDRPADAGPPRFLADAMLERLARWLRALGHDTASAGAASDAELGRRAAAEGRWLLTRDRRLAREAPDGRGVLLRAGAPLDQLREVAASFALAPGTLFSRCLVCNAPLRPATEAEVVGAAPELCGRHRPPDAHACPECGRVYWEGSHTRRMRAALARTLGDAAP
jgi:hypothetical protein